MIDVAEYWAVDGPEYAANAKIVASFRDLVFILLIIKLQV